MTRGALLVNLGTPASPAVADVRSYLGEFLSDPFVIDLPGPLRALLVNAVILPFRPKRSAAAYRKIWDAAGENTGSPLLHYSRALSERLSQALDGIPVELAMRYGEPSIDRGLRQLLAQGIDQLLLIPLYPQHADSTRETTIRAVRERLPAQVQLEIVPPFFSQPDYLDAQANLLRRNLPARWDHLLLSYHGLPERHLIKADPTGSHCLRSPDCCDVPSTAHATCYRHQALTTSRRLAAALEIPLESYSISFQSRLGRLPWLSPYTDEQLAALPGRGVAHLVVACPAFVADNLETLEEIGMAGRQTFLDAGGETFTLIPCLNDDPAWVETLRGWCLDSSSSQTNAARSDTAR